LTNGQSSPSFFNDAFEHYNLQTIEFAGTGNMPIRQVAAYDGPDYAHTIKFNDANGNIVETFNPFKYTYATKSPYLIKENEELIGVYGIKDISHWFSAFGFIVKVMSQGN